MFNRKERRILALVCAVLLVMGLLIWWADQAALAEDEPSPTPSIGGSDLDNEPVATPAPSPTYTRVELGEFKMTAYCSCEKCCGYWATVRPLDKDGQPIVYTASGTVAKQGRTIAADTSVLPYGTEVWFDGPWGEQAFTVEDGGGAVKGKHIDIYFDDHEAACQWALRTREVWLYAEEETNG